MTINSRISLTAVLLLAGFTFSCDSTHELYRGFTKSKASLSYLHDSKSKPGSRQFVISMPSPVVADTQFTEAGVINKVKENVVPLLIYNSWESEFDYQLGKMAIQEDVGSFVKKAFSEEAKRSSSFEIASDSARTAFTLEIEIDSLGGSGVYLRKGYFVFLFIAVLRYREDRTAPAVAHSRFHYRLKRNDEVVLEDYVSSLKRAEPFQVNPIRGLPQFYNTNMVETLALTFKDNIQTMIKRIDRYLLPEEEKRNK